MPNFYQVPLTPNPQTITVSLGGAQYQLTFLYRNTTDGGWTMDIADANGNPILQGVPLVTGADLLAQYQYVGFGGSLFVQNPADPGAVPTFENLGTDCLVYWVTQ